MAVVTCSLACATPEAPSSSPDGTFTTEASGGHQRMVELLARVADEAIEDNPYLGSRWADDIRQQLGDLPDAPDLRRWLFHRLLGNRELMLGNPEQAIEHHQAAYRELAVFPQQIPPEEQLKTVFELAVAYLRQGETRNCVAHHDVDSCIFPIRAGGVHVERDGSRRAIHYLTEVLKRVPSGSYYDLKARWLLNIAYMTLGEYPDSVPDRWRIAPETFDSDESFPRFVDVAGQLGLDAYDLAGGAVVDDFNGDGWLDILTSTSDTSGSLHYFVNEGDGRFTERTESAGLVGLWGGLNLVQADYDNDGDVDVLVLRGAWWRSNGRHPNSLLRNNGDDTFTDVTFEAGLGDVHFPTQTAAWADYDNDGDLDLYIGNETNRSRAVLPQPGDTERLATDAPAGVTAPCQLFRNNADGTFTDVAAAAGVTNDLYTKSVAWGDYDGDRYPDLYVSNIMEPNRLYRNNGDGTFTDRAEALGVAGPLASFPAWFWDYDNDGAMDLLVTAYGGRQLPPDVALVAASYLGLPNPAELPALYRGDGGGAFTDRAAEANLGRVTLPMGSNYGDLDNDGWLDFYLGTGYPYYEGLMPNVMYRNREGRSFADISTSGGFGHLQKGHGVVFADLDHDGDQDVVQQIGGFYPGDAFANALFRNPGGFGHHWIKLRLVGTRSNRSAIGARIRIDVTEGGARRSIYRWVGSGGSFGGNPLRQEIGLGRAERVDRLEIWWPTTDRSQNFEGLSVDRLYEVVEDADAPVERPLETFALGSDPLRESAEGR